MYPMLQMRQHTQMVTISLLPEYVCEESISPLPSVGVEHSIEILLWDSLGVNDVRHSLHPFQSL